jgi:hypothetical protein
VARAGPRCLYCGAELGEAVPVGEEPPDLSAAPVADRGLVVLRLTGAAPAALRDALGLSSYEAGQRSRRGGWELLRVTGREEAAAEVARLAGHGLRAVVVPETEVRAAAMPQLVRGGQAAAGQLDLHGAAGRWTVSSAALLLIVRGPIAREYQTSQEVKRVRTSGLEPGYRLHLHLRDERSPLELDPGDFAFGAEAGGGSSLLRLTDWVEAACRDTPVDDEFRRIPPALGAAAAGAGPLAAAGALRGSAGRARGRDELLILDNLAQFRFYSAWRGCVERRRY